MFVSDCSSDYRVLPQSVYYQPEERDSLCGGLGGLSYLRINFRNPVRFGPHTLDSPIRYEVWRDFALCPDDTLDLLLEPVSTVSVTQFTKVLLDGLAAVDTTNAIPPPAVADAVVLLTLGFTEFLQVVLPLTSWGDLVSSISQLSVEELVRNMDLALKGDSLSSLPGSARSNDELMEGAEKLRWFLLVTGQIGCQTNLSDVDSGSRPNIHDVAAWLHDVFSGPISSHLPPIRTVSLNRTVQTTVLKSRTTVKADAAFRLFDIDATEIAWAVVDSGIEARHPAFRLCDPGTKEPYANAFEQTERRWANRTRVKKTYDLTGARTWLQIADRDEANEFDVGARIESSGLVEMGQTYRGPQDSHGTHVAGVIGADWRCDPEPMTGVCPQISLWDFRVLDDKGHGDEFSVLTALNHIRRINQEAGRLRIAGVNFESLAAARRRELCLWLDTGVRGVRQACR